MDEAKYTTALRELKVDGGSICCSGEDTACLTWAKLGGTALQQLYMDSCHITVVPSEVYLQGNSDFWGSDLFPVQSLTHLIINTSTYQALDDSDLSCIYRVSTLHHLNLLTRNAELFIASDLTLLKNLESLFH